MHILIFLERGFLLQHCTASLFLFLLYGRNYKFSPFSPWILMLESIFLVFWKDKFIVNILCFTSLLTLCLELEIFKFKGYTFLSLVTYHALRWRHQQFVPLTKFIFCNVNFHLKIWILSYGWFVIWMDWIWSGLTWKINHYYLNLCVLKWAILLWANGGCWNLPYPKGG